MRASTTADGTLDASVDGEWSFAQTLRHLVMATDTWLGKAVLQRDRPYHPHGLPDASYAADGGDTTVFASRPPTYAEVLGARADRVTMVADFLAELTPEVLIEQRPNPHDPHHAETVLACLRTILEEEWEHHRYAVGDLDALVARG